MSYKKCERLLANIDSSFREFGKNRVFLIGDNLRDIFLNDLKVGAWNVLENLKMYTEETEEFKWFIYFKSNGQVEFLQKNGKGKLEKKENVDFLTPKINKKANALLKSSKKDEKSKTAKAEDTKDVDEKVEETTGNIQDKLQVRVLDIIFDNKRKDQVLLYIEDFDWLAKFYDAENDNTLIKKIIEMDKLKRHLIVISLKTMDLLEQKFAQKYDENDVIKIGSPSKKEIELMLHRISWKVLGEDISTLNYDTLSSQFSNANYSLRESSKILRKKIKEYGAELTIENFEFKEKVQEKVTWDDIVLDPKTMKRVKTEVSDFIKGKEEKKKGAVLTGPPGTGKTYIAKAMATEGKVYFMCPKLSDLKGEYVGQSAPKVRDLFEEARANQPTLIFLDELDTLFPSRGSNIDGDSYTKDMTNEFLQQLDGVNTGTQKIYVLAATNRIESIDSAVRSRLGAAIEIGLPGVRERRILFEKNMEPVLNKKFWEELSETNLQDLEKRSEGMSGRDIKNFCTLLGKSIAEEGKMPADDTYRVCFKVAFELRKNEIIQTLKNTTSLKCKNPADILTRKLFGIDRQIEKICRVLDKITPESRKRRSRYSGEMENGILLYGPPGNGKSELIDLVARKKGMILIKVESKDFIGYTPKDTLSSIDDIFSKALHLSRMCDENEGVVLFFDEFDSLVGENLSPAVRGTILGKLADKTGVRAQDSKIIVAAATNFYYQLDDAVKRYGRFDCHVQLENPSRDTAYEIIENMFKDQKIIMIGAEDESEYIKEFYQIVKDDSLDKYLENKRLKEIDRIDEKRVEEVKKFINFIKETYTPSSSDISIMVTKLKNFIIENLDPEAESSSHDLVNSVSLSKVMLESFKESL